MVNGVDDRLKAVLTDIAEEMGCSIQTMEVMPDHIHIFLKRVPTLPIHLIVRSLKGKSSKILRQEFPISKRGYPVYGQEVTTVKQ